MKVGYNKPMGKFYIGLGAFFSLVSILILLGGGGMEWRMFISSLFLMFLGFSFVKQNYFELGDNKITFHGMIGRNPRNIEFSSLKDFSISGKKVYLDQNSKRKKLPILAWAADKKELDAFFKHIQKA